MRWAIWCLLLVVLLAVCVDALQHKKSRSVKRITNGKRGRIATDGPQDDDDKDPDEDKKPKDDKKTPKKKPQPKIADDDGTDDDGDFPYSDPCCCFGWGHRHRRHHGHYRRRYYRHQGWRHGWW